MNYLESSQGQHIQYRQPYLINQYPPPVYNPVYAPFISGITPQYQSYPAVNPANQMIQGRALNPTVYPNNLVKSVVVSKNPIFNPANQLAQIPQHPNQNIPGNPQILNANLTAAVLNVHAPPYNFQGRHENILSNQMSQTQAQNAPLPLENAAHFQENNTVEVDLHRNDVAFSMQSNGPNVDHQTVKVKKVDTKRQFSVSPRENVATTSSNTANEVDDDETDVENIVDNAEDNIVCAASTEHQTDTTKPSNVRANETNASGLTRSSEKTKRIIAQKIKILKNTFKNITAEISYVGQILSTLENNIDDEVNVEAVAYSGIVSESDEADSIQMNSETLPTLSPDMAVPEVTVPDNDSDTSP